MTKQTQLKTIEQYTDRRKRSILITDDEVINQMILTEMLSSDYELLYASDGEEALEVIRNNSESLSLVLLDIMMPGMTGSQVLEEIKANPEIRDIPVVIMTSQWEEEEHILELGASDFIIKPFSSPGVIRARIANIIRMAESVRIIKADKYDAVTGLLRMRRFLDLVEDARASAEGKMSSRGYALVYFNLVDFKLYNSINGLEEGDRCLLEIGNVLLDEFREQLVSRFSGDHFVVFTQNIDIEERVESICRRIAALDIMSNMKIKSGIRYITSMDDSQTAVAMCDQAKLACDTIKRNAGKSYHVYDKQLNDDLELRQYIVENFDNALRMEYIQPFYQPVVRSVTGALCGEEALARWLDPEKGFISPGVFIPALEDARLIHKLTAFMIESVCRDYRRCIGENRPIVPISINLSRLDFVLTDIVQIVFDTMEKYEVPREMINIEITESMFVEDAELMGREIQRFHDHGFKVWMDDFGSGNSSLNILKDYDFDELKIDMKFLSSFSDKSRNIIKSIVHMAKDIGIQTLAEGVETREQYEFLRDIGCEKIQGYYFGKPAPCDLAISRYRSEGIVIETKSWADYYDKMGRLDFLTDKPLAIFEDDGSYIKFIFANKAFRDSLASNGTDSLEDSETSINAVGTPLHSLLRKFFDGIIISGEKESLTYPSGDQYMSLTARNLARCNGRYLHAGSLDNITRSADKTSQANHDAIMRNLFYLYDMIAVMDRQKDTMEFFDVGHSKRGIKEYGIQKGIIKSTLEFRNSMIFADDRDDFAAFTDPHSMMRKISESENGMVSDYFRIKETDGNYVWHICVVMRIPKMADELYLIATRKASFDDPAIRSKLLTVYSDDMEMKQHKGNDEEFTDLVLWKNLRDYSSVKYFWKDKERRFIGVSRSFLDYYGLDSDDDVIGRTDEDMRWHVSDGPFRSDELDVLNRGRHITNAPGKCIIRGSVHNILASKMPVYRDGKIVGLFGYFIDAEQEMDPRVSESQIVTTDIKTGLANTRGIINQFMDYAEEYENTKTDFVAMNVHIDGFDEFRDEYGTDNSDELLHRIADILLDNFGTEAAIGRVMGSRFVALYKAPEQMRLNSIMDNIKTDIRHIHEINGCSCTCFTKYSLVYACNSESMEHMLNKLITMSGK